MDAPRRLPPGRPRVSKVDLFVEYTKTMSGRDKLTRLVQYIVRLVALITSGTALSHALKVIDSNVAAARRVYRLGRTAETAQRARGALRVADPVLRTMGVVNAVCLGCWYVGDHYMWALKLGILRGKGRRLGKVLSYVMLVAMVASLIKDVYRVARTATRHNRDHRGQAPAAEDRDVVLDTAATTLDWLIVGARKLAPSLKRDLFETTLNLCVSLIACRKQFRGARERVLADLRRGKVPPPDGRESPSGPRSPPPMREVPPTMTAL